MTAPTTRQKSDTFPTLSHFSAFVSTQFGRTVRSVQCDNGREFDNSSARTFFLSHGVQLRMSCPYTSSQNGKTERMIRTTNDFMCPCCSRLPFQPVTRLRAFTLPPISLTFYPQRRSQPAHPTLLFSAPLLPTPTFGSSDVPATRTPLRLLPIS
jgi:hypothetical protein